MHVKVTRWTVLSIFFIFLVWILAGIIIDNELLLPRPGLVFKALFDLLTDGASLLVILKTILRLLLGLIIAFVVGFLCGVLAAFKTNFALFINPIVTVLRTIPVISITVILLIISGFETTPYIITFLMLFPLIYQVIYGAIKDLDPALVDVYLLEDNHFMTRLIHCYIPLISTQIRTALLQSLGLGIKVLVMAEYLSQTRQSIGNELYLAKVNLQYDEVFAWTLLLIFMALLFEAIINHYKPVTKINKKTDENEN